MRLRCVHCVDDDGNRASHDYHHADDVGLVLEASVFGGSNRVDALLHEDVEQELGDDIEHDANQDRRLAAVAVHRQSDSHVYVVEDYGTCDC